MPKWAEVVLVPLISLVLAAILSALVILAIGEDPVAAVKLMISGALGSTYGWGYTLYYATNFMFTGLAVAVAFHAGLFNIGGEGQAMLGGLGAALICLFIPWPHWSIAVIAATVGAALFGALWAAIPAYLQAKRGSHIVITTIMFNFIAAAVLNYMLVNVLRPAGSMDPATARFPGDRAPAFTARYLSPYRRQLFQISAGQCLVADCDCGVRNGVAVDLADVAGAGNPVIRQIRAGGPLCRDRGRQDHNDRNADLGWAGWHDGHQQRDGRGRAIGTECRRRGRFHRYCRGAHGAQPSLWRVPRRDPIWISVPRWRRTGALDIDTA